MSVRTRLALLVMSIMLPALLAAMWVLGVTYRMEREANERLLKETARAVSMVLDGELAQRRAVVRALSLSRMLDDAPDIDPETLRAFDLQARRTLQGLRGWLEVRTADKLLIDTRLPLAEPPSDTLPGAADDDMSDSPVVKPLAIDARQGAYHAALVEPLRRDGQTVLNLKLTVLPEEMQAIIDRQQLAPDWVGAVLDSDGRVVARHPGGVAFAGREATPDLRERLAMHREGLMESISLDGKPVMAYFNTSPQGWTYITAMPREDFEGVVPKAVLNVAFGALVLMGLALLGSARVSSSIVAPIVTLKDAAARMEAGAAVEPAPTGISECDEVAAAMAKASRSMRNARLDMERQVAGAVAQTRNAEQRLSSVQRVEALGRLTGGVAHDFNNLLGVISNSAYLMQRRVTAPELAAPIAATLRAVESGSRLTQHLLRFAGRQSVRPRTVYLSDSLPEIGELMKSVLGSRIALSIDVHPATQPIFVDPSELELSLINLGLNARDAITERGEVWVRAANADRHDAAGLPPGDYVIITVSDSGAGIDEGTAKRVFEPFFSTKSSEQGSGLGLSQVYGFCQQAGGTARLDSTPGLGTTVSLLLPMKNNMKTEPGLLLPADGASIEGARVLLIDDNEALRDVTAALLTSYGCDVETCSTAEQALQRVHQPPAFDVVLTDVLMPGGMDGVALARRLRQELPQLPVVLISGHSGDVALNDGFRLLRKPCSPEALVAVLYDAISTSRS
ncbi:MAG: response regulator [Hydrogenophaga sp.]|nr:response regulator [Hydrogenophaga sp.]